MKIEGSSKPVGAPLVKDARSSSTRTSSTATDSDVQLSSLATQLRSADDGYTFDSARVAEIKQAIAEGRFTINAGAIADRLITSAKELMDSNKQA